MDHLNYNVEEKDMKELRNYLKVDGILFTTMTSFKRNHRTLLVDSLGGFPVKCT